MKKLGIITSIVLLIVINLTLISAIEGTWNNFGNSENNIKQLQASTLTSDINITEVTSFTINIGQNQSIYPTQPLFSQIGDSSLPYIITHNITYINIIAYDGINFYKLGNYSLFYEPEGSLAIDDTTGNKYIIGMFRINSSYLIMERYNYDATTQTISFVNNNSYEYSDTAGSTGFRCDDNHCYAINYVKHDGGYSLYDIGYNSSLNRNYLLINGTNNTHFVTEPPSKIRVQNSDIFLTFTEDWTYLYNHNSSNLFRTHQLHQNPGVDWAEYQRAVKFYVYSIDSVNATPIYNYSVVEAFEIPSDLFSAGACISGGGDIDSVGAYSCSKIRLLDINLNEFFEQSIDDRETSGNPTPRIRGLAIGEYNGNINNDEIFVVNQEGHNIVIFSNNGTRIYDTNNTRSIAIGGNSDETYPRSMISLGRFSQSNTDLDILIYDYNGYIRVFSPSSDSIIFSENFTSTTGQGSCIPIDVSQDGFLDIACSNDKLTTFFRGNQLVTPVINDTIITGSENINNIVERVNSWFPEADDLTTSQKIIFVIIGFLLVFLIIFIPVVMVDRFEHIALILYLIAFIEVLVFFFFVAIGYIDVGVLVLIVLIMLAISYFKIAQAHK